MEDHTDVSKIFKKLLHKRAIVIGAAIVSSFAVLSAYWFLIDGEAQRITALTHERASMVKSVDALSRLYSQEATAGLYYDDLLSVLPEEIDAITTVPGIIQNIGDSNNLRVQVDIGATNEPAGAVPANLSLSIKADGTMENIGLFIDELEKSYLYYELTSFSIKPLADEVYQLILEGRVFMR